MNRRLIIISCLMLLTACSGPKLGALTADAVILAFGDSLTSGVGARKNKNYPAVLAQLTGLQVINAGIAGETTAQGLARLGQALDQSSPDLVILIEGGNDMLRGLDLVQAKANLRKMVMLIRQRNIDLVLMGVPKKSLFLSVHPMYEELATELDLVFDGELLVELQGTAALKSDIVHFNEMGYQKMAESIYAILEKRGAL
ncbi:MAG: acyl-CoA thioesterase-1 [Pseudohongiellaceae bacterium]|jgi:acyl-CoA thioesterase-1